MLSISHPARRSDHPRLAAAAAAAAAGLVGVGVMLLFLVAAAPAAAQRGQAIVRGTVTTAEGVPLAGAEVTLLPAGADGADGADGAAQPGAEPVAAATTDEAGRFKIEVRKGLPGAFSLRVVAAGYQPLEGPVELAAGQEGTVNVELVSAEQSATARAQAIFNEGVQAVDRGELALAAEHFEEALEIDPELARAHLGLAQVRLAQKRPAEAVTEIELYLSQQPDDPNGHLLAYHVYRAAEDEEGATRARTWLGAAGAGAELASVVYNEGVAALREGETERALEQFGNALELDPGLLPAARAIATVHYEQGRYKEAAAEAARLVERAPDDAGLLRLRFAALEATDDPAADSAFDAWAAADAAAATELLWELAEKTFETDRREDVERHLVRLLRVDPDHAEAHYLLGLVYVGDSRNEAAKKHFRRFLELAPHDPKAADAREFLDLL